MTAVQDIIRDTDERLRTWDLTQADRERLCIDVLAVDPHYSDTRPRRPRGGPDGGRDIEAVYNGFTPACGAVGFRTPADDSPTDHRWAMAKFRTDLQAALSAVPGTRHFTFFTNVDLTPSEQQDLVSEARRSGVTTDLYYRERIRSVLCRPEGVLIRARYLKIPLTEEEQFALFDRFGEAVALATRHTEEQLSTQFGRIEFNTRRPLPVQDCEFSVGLRTPLTATEIGTYGVVLEIFDPRAEDASRLYLANLADHMLETPPAPLLDWRDQPMEGPFSTGIFQQRQVVWTTRPGEVHRDEGSSYRATMTRVLRTSSRALPRAEWTLLDSFNRTCFAFFITSELVEQIEWLAFYVDEWALFILPINVFEIEVIRPVATDTTERPFIDWPEDVAEPFKGGFATLYPTAEAPLIFHVDASGFLHTNFALYAPVKAVHRPFPGGPGPST